MAYLFRWLMPTSIFVTILPGQLKVDAEECRCWMGGGY